MWRKVRDGILVLFLTIVFAAGLKSCIIDAYRIPTASMSSTLLPGDFLLVNKFIYGAQTPSVFLYIHLPTFRFPTLKKIARGEIIVFEFPGEANERIPVRHQYLVKRCVGLPGDTVDVTGGVVHINGYEFPHLKKSEKDFPKTIVPFPGMIIHLDSVSLPVWNIFIQREGHSVFEENGNIFIDGIQSVWYTVQNNYYFGLGDNINNSYDSRFWGFIPQENIVGEAMVIYWSKDENGIRWNRIGKPVR
jgi:signal peptidase I